MYKRKFLIGIDVGTSAVKTGIFDIYGKVLVFSSSEYKVIFPKPGWAEQNPADWWIAIKKTVNECLIKGKLKPEQIIAISLATTSATLVPSNNKGQALDNAILWMDNRAYNEVEEITKNKNQVLKFAGNSEAIDWMIPKILWLKRNRKDLYKKSEKLVDCLDWLVYKLTGNWTCSMCNTTVAWNYAKPMGGWVKSFFNEINLGDIFEKWPERILFMGDCVGKLSRKASKWLGLKEGVPVAEGGIDSHAGMIGLGVVNPKILAMIIGSSTAHLIFSKEPKYIPGIWGPFPEPVIRGLWLNQGGQSSTGSIVKWFKDNLAYKSQIEAKKRNINIYKLLDQKASNVPIGSEGLIVLDFWQGNRCPYKDPLARGVISGLSLGHYEEHIFRAILEGTAYGTRNVIDRCFDSDLEISEIRACGGGTKSLLWLQIHSDVCGLPIYTTEVSEAGCLGAAICAAVGAGIYSTIEEAAKKMVYIKEKIDPNLENYKIYSSYFKKYKETYHGLKKIMHKTIN